MPVDRNPIGKDVIIVLRMLDDHRNIVRDKHRPVDLPAHLFQPLHIGRVVSPAVNPLLEQRLFLIQPVHLIEVNRSSADVPHAAEYLAIPQGNHFPGIVRLVKCGSHLIVKCFQLA